MALERRVVPVRLPWVEFLAGRLWLVVWGMLPLAPDFEVASKRLAGRFVRVVARWVGVVARW